MALEEIKKSLSEGMESITDKLKDSFSLLKDLKDAGTDKLSSIANDVLGLSPLIEQTGFSMTDISVDITLPPGITISFDKKNDIDPDAINKMLEENEDKQLLKLIVTALQKADEAQKKMNMGEYTFRGLSMKIGLPPDISLKFSKR